MIAVIDVGITTQLVQPPVQLTLSHNLPLDVVDYWLVQFVHALTIERSLVVRGSALRFSTASVTPGVSYKLLAFGVQNGLVEGMYWSDGYVLDDQQASIAFTSGSAATPTGESKQFSGSVQIAGQGVSRKVVAVALDADPPYLLAQTQSAANGSYTLEWQGYSGQMLVTALDDYGQPFAPGMTLGAGDRVHPAAPNGFVYQAAGLGITGPEPVWPTVEGDSVTTGEVQLVAVPFWRPKSAGPFSV